MRPLRDYVNAIVSNRRIADAQLIAWSAVRDLGSRPRSPA